MTIICCTKSAPNRGNRTAGLPAGTYYLPLEEFPRQGRSASRRAIPCWAMDSTCHASWPCCACLVQLCESKPVLQCLSPQAELTARLHRTVWDRVSWRLSRTCSLPMMLCWICSLSLHLCMSLRSCGPRLRDVCLSAISTCRRLPG